MQDYLVKGATPPLASFFFSHMYTLTSSHTLTLSPLIVRAWGETGVNQAEFPVIQTEPKG